MCGICGIFDNSNRYGEQDLNRMNETMYNRGPDGAGVHFENGYGIAMRRLSIIDLNNGWQPIFSEDDSIVVVLNGEIYNYKELRLELIDSGHIFSTESDTEVIVHGYEEWGINELLDRIDGMHGFCIWDKKRNKAFLARDKFGEKPLYYYHDKEKVLFSSQMLTVAKVLGKRPTINKAAAYLYLGLHFIPGNITIFEKINKLLPGEFCEIDLETLSIKNIRYWELKEQSSESYSASKIKEILKQSVKSRMVADVPVGVFLSGGLDSSLIAALAKEENSKLETFSIGFKGTSVDESHYSQMVANHIGSTHRHFDFDVQNFVELIPKVIETMDEPIGDQAMLPVYWLSHEASKYVKVVMGGDGADELFGGYGYYCAKAFKPNLKNRLKHLHARWKNRKATENELFLSINETQSGFPLLTNEDERQRLLGLLSSPSIGSWFYNFSNKLTSTFDPLKRATLCDIETWLPEDLCMKFDKMAMGNSLEGRSPYLNPKIAEIAMRLPLDKKIKNGSRKILLKEVADQILPYEVVHREKQGFILPMKKWLADELRDELLLSIKECPDETLDKEYLEQIVVEDIQQGVNRERFLYAILIYNKWIKYAFDEIKKYNSAI